MRHTRQPLWTEPEKAGSDPPEGSCIRGVVFALGPTVLLWIAVGALLWWAVR